jgi:PAS domain S-box-containing protein
MLALASDCCFSSSRFKVQPGARRLSPLDLWFASAPFTLDHHLSTVLGVFGSTNSSDNGIHSVHMDRGKTTHFVSSEQNVAARKQAEMALRDSEQLFSVFMANLPVATFIKDQEGNMLFANKFLQDTFGWRQWEGKSTGDLFPGELARQITEADREALRQGLLVVQETNMDARGHERIFETYRFPIRVEGKPVLLGGVAVDITERRELEAQLRQAQKMEGIGRLAGGVAHDFNNMLAVIRGNAELLLMNAEQFDGPTNDCLKQVIAAAERAANLTRQLLAFGRNQIMRAQPSDLNEVVGNLTKMFKRIIGEDIDLQCQFVADLPSVEADIGMIEQIIVNLVVNARDAMPRGGKLLITTDITNVDLAYTHTHLEARAGKFVSLTVSDTGTGITPEHLPRIFEPFFTTKESGKGTGLGLAMVYGIVKQHQGWVEVSSRVGEGSIFKVFLPALPPRPRTAASSEPDAALRGGTETILLVEDDSGVRMTTRRVLESLGYRVCEATSAREALEIWRGRPEEIALLLTDVIMPESVTGRELAEQLRAERPGLKVIFLSGYAEDVAGRDTDFIRRTKSRFLQKPCSSRTLLATVRECLDED